MFGCENDIIQEGGWGGRGGIERDRRGKYNSAEVCDKYSLIYESVALTIIPSTLFFRIKTIITDFLIGNVYPFHSRESSVKRINSFLNLADKR